jgi:DNA-binding SARP family transcriptional activator
MAQPYLAQMRLLGRFELIGADGRAGTPRSAKGRAILAYLALSQGGTADRGRLAGLVWGEGTDAKASLRQCLRELRQTLAGAGLDALLQTDLQRATLDLRHLWIDALEVRRLAHASDPAEIEATAALYAGDLLEEVGVRDPGFEDWLAIEREALRQQVCVALETWTKRCLEQRALERAVRMARALLAIDPTHEAAHQALMRCHALRGDVPAAIRQYQACSEALARGLDVEPSAETKTLLREIRGRTFRREEPVQPRPAGPIVAACGPPTHVSIAVVERLHRTADPADAAVSTALAAGLREALARKRWLSVLDSRAARLFLSGTAALTRDEPQYRIVLSFLRVGDRIRFSAELQSAATARILWAEHYDRRLGEDITDLVDDLARVLARRLDREIELAEIMRASQRPLEVLSAYDCTLRAIPLIFKLTAESFAEADQLLLAAQNADPNDPFVYAWRAFWYSIYIGQGWAMDLATARAELDFLVRRAIELDPKNALALAVAGHIASYIHFDYDRALTLFRRSLQLDPNSAYAWDFSAVTLSYTGNAREALRQLETSRDLWEQHPDPYYFRTSECIALLLAGRPEKAAAVGRRTVRENPNFQAAYRPLIASLGLMGEIEEARAFLTELRRLAPDFSADWFRANYPPLRGEHGDLYMEGLRKAGVTK